MLNSWKHLYGKVFGAEHNTAIGNLPQVPENSRVYTIGDIHGKVDTLQKIHALIIDDAASVPSHIKLFVIYLGDYIDRGMHSREVIDLLIDSPLPGFESVYLRGNHDQEMLNFLNSPDVNAPWLDMGGSETAYSYGVRVPKDALATKRLYHIRDDLSSKLPASHLHFLKELKSSYTLGDYFFAHAGINPENGLTSQSTRDLVWGNKKFLKSNDDFGKVVVHGHTVSDEPVIRDNRISIDTGAFLSNVLTCLVLEKETRRFLSTPSTYS